MIALVLIVALLFVYGLLILRPGSSWWIERALRAGNCVQSPAVHLPLLGALTGFDSRPQNVFRVATDELEAPEFTNFYGNVVVTCRSFEQNRQLWEKIEALPKHQPSYAGLELLTFGPSILTLNGDAHSQRRKPLSRAFRDLHLIREAINAQTEAMLLRWQRSRKEIHVLSETTSLTVGVILEALSGKRPDPEHVRTCIVPMLQYMIEYSWTMARFPLSAFLWAQLPWTKFANTFESYRQFLSSMVDDALHSPAPGSLLAILIEAGLTTRAQLLPEVALLLFAGSETTASAITTAVKELAQNPDLAAKVRADGSYSMKVFKECLRHTPPVASGTVRELTEDIEICVQGKVFKFPRGCLPIPFIAPYHRAERNWERANDFDPERDMTQGRSVAFSLGPRNCVGMPLAMLEGPTVIKAIFDEFSKVELAPGSVPSLHWSQTFKYANLIVQVGY